MALTLTDAAAAKVLELIQEENNPAYKLRAYVTGGGCSGYQYGFTFDETADPEDRSVVNESQTSPITLLVDPVSYEYLKGATIDYKEDLEGARFTILNPNAKTTCGCGSSFAT